ncbi:TetR/AcrR family transcriptional regulator, partial [Streptomyces sp. NPDC049577]|uniref:TetR/AcrR family transcriptional regulator n=1 Tax=Streptomyces sp. NPDC049577 TaxID=3155153 RepID=UPI0034280595
LYLNSKEQLFSACIQREAEGLLGAVRDAVEPGAPADRRLWNALRAFFAHTAEHPAGWAVLSCQARMHGEPFTRAAASLRQEIAGLLAGLIAESLGRAAAAGAPGEREVSGLAHALVGAAESLAGWANSTATEANPAPSAQETAETLMNVAWVGLENLMGGRRWLPAAP